MDPKKKISTEKTKTGAQPNFVGKFDCDSADFPLGSSEIPLLWLFFWGNRAFRIGAILNICLCFSKRDFLFGFGECVWMIFISRWSRYSSFPLSFGGMC